MTRATVPPASSTPIAITKSLRARMVRSTLAAMTERSGSETVTAVTASEAEAGERLDRVLAAHLGAPSRTRLKRLIEAGQVSLDGATISEPSLRVKPGQCFQVAVPPPADDRPAPQALAVALDVRFEDEHVIVIDKPA